MIYAREKNIPIDVFVIFTDSETKRGRNTPIQSLKRYRDAMSLPRSKLVVCAMRTTGFSIADPDDPGMIDICGFDRHVPQLIREFATADDPLNPLNPRDEPF